MSAGKGDKPRPANRANLERGKDIYYREVERKRRRENKSKKDCDRG
jgi:hypothetical protein